MALKKRDLGINGVHSKLGLEITEAEFRGYMVAKMEETARRHEEMKMELQEVKTLVQVHAKDDEITFSKHNTRITSLENTNLKATGFIAGIATVAGIVTTLIITVLLKWLKL